MEDNKKIKIQIKSVYGDVLFEYEKENNTIKDTVEEAVRQGANLRGANLEGANLRGAYLEKAHNIPYIPLACPSDGTFVAWKKIECYLIKLEIPEDARRSSATTRKCRCDKAKVLDITHLTTNEPITEVTNTAYSPEITYKVGEMVYPNMFDDNRCDECSYGIHFFINKQDAINY